MLKKITLREKAIFKVTVSVLFIAFIFNVTSRFFAQNIFALGGSIADREYIIANSDKINGLMVSGTSDQLFTALNQSAAKQQGLTIVKMQPRKSSSNRGAAMEVEVTGGFAQIFTFMNDTLSALPRARIISYRLNVLSGANPQISCVMTVVL